MYEFGSTMGKLDVLIKLTLLSTVPQYTLE